VKVLSNVPFHTKHSFQRTTYRNSGIVRPFLKFNKLVYESIMVAAWRNKKNLCIEGG
jgi:hypothetical protein